MYTGGVSLVLKSEHQGVVADYSRGVTNTQDQANR